MRRDARDLLTLLSLFYISPAPETFSQNLTLAIKTARVMTITPLIRARVGRNPVLFDGIDASTHPSNLTPLSQFVNVIPNLLIVKSCLFL